MGTTPQLQIFLVYDLHGFDAQVRAFLSATNEYTANRQQNGSRNGREASPFAAPDPFLSPF